MATHAFPAPLTWFNIFHHKLEKHLARQQTRPNVFISLEDHADEAPLANIKMERQRWPAKPLISGRSGTQYVAMVTKLVCSYYGAHLLESYCKESSISDTNFLGYLSPTYLIIIRLSLWRHHLAAWQICIFWKLEYLWNKKRYLKIVNSILLLVQTTCLCL